MTAHLGFLPRDRDPQPGAGTEPDGEVRAVELVFLGKTVADLPRNRGDPLF